MKDTFIRRVKTPTAGGKAYDNRDQEWSDATEVLSFVRIIKSIQKLGRGQEGLLEASRRGKEVDVQV